jgi:hypothetical protein
VDKQTHHTIINQRVRLKGDGQDQLYEDAYAGSEGWVRAQRFDRYGYPEVKIEWDQDHWSYNKQADQWAMEAHFEPVKGSMSENNDATPSYEDFKAYQKWLAEQGKNEQPPVEDDVDSADERAEVDEHARAIIENAEAYALVAVERSEENGRVGFLPRFVFAQNTDVSSDLVELQILRVTHQLADARLSRVVQAQLES